MGTLSSGKDLLGHVLVDAHEAAIAVLEELGQIDERFSLIHLSDSNVRDRLCKCGHPYYRHFDTYAEMDPVGCKYCHCHVEGIDYREEIPLPADLKRQLDESTDFTKVDIDWNQYASICSGFSLAEGQ